MKQIRYVLILLLAGASFLTSCTAKKEKQDTAIEPVENVRVMPLESKNIARELDYSTNLQAFEKVNVVPVSPGRIESILVEVGSYVKKGQVVVKMDPTSYQQAKIQYANQENDFKRYEALKGSDAISQQTYDQLKSQLEVQRSSIDYLERNAVIKAPFDGIISVKNLENGDLYSGAVPILTELKIDQLKAYIDVPERFYRQIRKGMKVSLVTEVYPEKNFNASIYNVAPTIDAATRSFKVEIHIPNAGNLLKPGMFGRVKMNLGNVSAIVVPYQTVLKTQGSNERFVFVNKNGIAKRYVVTLGKRFDDQVEIISDSIKLGDNLVVVGQSRLIEGVKLNVVD